MERGTRTTIGGSHWQRQTSGSGQEALLVVGSRTDLDVAEVPIRLWEVVSIDFVTGLPMTQRGVNAFTTFTCKLSKIVHVVPVAYNDSSSAKAVVRLFMNTVWKLHGAPMRIVCDRDHRFRDAMTQELMRLMGVKVASTTPYQPQSDGQAERGNHTVERMLRCYVAQNQEDWDLWETRGVAAHQQMLAKQFAQQLQAARASLQTAQQRVIINQFDVRHRLQQIKKVNDQEAMAPPPVMVEGQREREVGRIISTRFRKLEGKAGETAQEWLTK
ncbi:hypothetical protein CYMTET_18993 [Cymbomonas tetramitiformis]|uniref:Integrase catalytic domain-containing protein n=1 Tax=Cymbomonas tetramitiformis TaxID=36881 RepID=A0AAE0G727_9CHLO|nr:hypothetical protein CYMTET_18993 [Cymbomonas tetramitiformis]